MANRIISVLKELMERPCAAYKVNYMNKKTCQK